LAVRHRQRAFVFWTYVIALAEDPLIRLAAETLARQALSDGNLLRRERRLAWRAERTIEDAATSHEPASAALPESLLLKDMIACPAGTPLGSRSCPSATAFPGADRPRRQQQPGIDGHRKDQAPCATSRRAIVEHLPCRSGQR